MYKATKETQESERDKLARQKEETNMEATNRICAERRALKFLENRRDTVTAYFFELTGIPMSEEQFLKYNELFDKAEDGYNIKSFIKNEKIRPNLTKINETFFEFLKSEGIKEE